MWQSENGLFIDADSVFLFATKLGRNPNRTSLPRQLCERNRTGKPLFAESNSYFRSESPATHRPLGSRPASPDGQRFRFLLPRKSDALPPHVIWRSEGLFIRIRGFVFCPITRTRTQVGGVGGGGDNKQKRTNTTRICRRNEVPRRRTDSFFVPKTRRSTLGSNVGVARWAAFSFMLFRKSDAPPLYATWQLERRFAHRRGFVFF